jgi:hypothetical protein
MLTLGGVPEQDHVAIERLAALQDQHLAAAVHILALLIDNAADPWFVLGSRDDIHTLLRAGLASEDEPIRDEARAATSRVVARGHPDFADLLA